ncbi:COG4315 family predicted lipoprotein [Kitasatospora cheerisanensis]|uniref:Lipoprotein n=1 Tax=Kitasatospora cheerisanensis KCTC 2395 TaxID=1348663 RepID=A0A066Z1B7_9ACTN|nr:hypothetical protein [Kitasatospora cheerisanensis]KDN86039.1 hypothetical protein KCH_18560 [Kitasatospora cheerisanensis KCTC 2395]
MPRTCRVAAAVLSLAALSALSAACGADPGPSAPPAAESARPASAPASASGSPGTNSFATAVGTQVSLASVGSLGPILVDAQGRSLYLFGADTSVHGSCLDECAKTWPPVTTPGFPLAGPGVDDGLLGAAALPDGTAQVLYKGHPLYRYAGDRGPGEAAGHTVANPQGGTFYAVTSLGDPVGVDISTLHGPGAAAGVPSGAATAGPGATADPSAGAPAGGTAPSAAGTAPSVPSVPTPPSVPAAPSAPAAVQPPDASGSGVDDGTGAGADTGAGGATGDDGTQDG